MGIVNLSNIALKQEMCFFEPHSNAVAAYTEQVQLCLTKAAPVTRLSTIDRGRFQKAALTEK